MTTATIDWSGLAERLADPDGGFTVNLTTGAEPATGYAVATHPERSWEAAADTVSAETVRTYAALNADLLNEDRNVLGGWHDPATHQVWLDVSTVVADEADAWRLAWAANQIAIFNLDTHETINTGGTGHVATAETGRN